ncbi:MAG: hypothetical protein U0572_13635 [Phycisphaerales bacterium]
MDIAAPLEDVPGFTMAVTPSDAFPSHFETVRLSAAGIEPLESGIVRLEWESGGSNLQIWRQDASNSYSTLALPVTFPLEDFLSPAAPTTLFVKALDTGVSRLRLVLESPQCPSTSDSITINVSPFGRGLIVSTIWELPTANWPGPKPAGMQSRLGYPPNATPTDDQIVFDVILNIPGGPAQELIAAIQAALADFNLTVQIPAQGALANATAEDKQWIVLAFLKRSKNNVPPTLIPENAIDQFIEDGDWRLINELHCRSEVSEQSAFAAAVELLASRHLIGPTPLQFLGPDPITTTFTVSGVPITFQLTLGKIVIGGNIADPADNNGLIVGGQIGEAVISQRTAGRIGPALEPAEKALIPKRAAPFASRLTFTAASPTVEFTAQFDGSQIDETIRWPRADGYRWNSELNAFQLQLELLPIATPFAWIEQFGSPWP